MSGNRRTDGILSFYSHVRDVLSEVLFKYRLRDARRDLRQCAMVESNGYLHGLRQAKQTLLTLLPYAQRVVDVVYERKSILCEEKGLGQGRGGRGKKTQAVVQSPTTTEDYLIILRVIGFEVLHDEIEGKEPFVRCFYNNQQVILHSPL